MSARRFLTAFFVASIGWLAVFCGVTWTIDPYGVSPVQISWDRINDPKPQRRDIDRLIKPYEVWRHQPRTVLLGSSRVAEAFDPSVFDGTRFAPAYNASVPANSLSLDAAQLVQYAALDPQLKVVFVELFFWNFIYPQPAEPRHGLSEFMSNSTALHLSMQTLWDAVLTVKANIAGKKTPHIGPRGNWLTLPDHNAKPMFGAYIPSIMKVHSSLGSVALEPSAFQALDRIVAIAKQHELELYLLITPNHPYDDYRLLSLGYWPLLANWHRRLARYPNVLGASQYAAALTEPVSERMLYWNDPIHPSAKFGELILRRFLGEAAPTLSAELVLPLNPETVEGILEARRRGLQEWLAKNPDFVAAFEKAKSAR